MRNAATNGSGRARLWVASAVLCAAAPGCSYLFVDGPPPGHEQLRYFDCTESRAAPVVDVAFAGIYGTSAVMQVAEGRAHYAPALAAALAVAAFEASSAIHGFSKTAECEAAKEKWAERAPFTGPRDCGSDLDCKGDRVCEAGLCVPLAQAAVPGPTAAQEPRASEAP